MHHYLIFGEKCRKNSPMGLSCSTLYCKKKTTDGTRQNWRTVTKTVYDLHMHRMKECKNWGKNVKDCFKGVLGMKDYKMQKEAVRLAYETPNVQFISWEDDVLAANGSMEVGGDAGGDSGIWG